ncbi:MAG: tetratricopeptide repeat protein [Owenweeksia sp.]|nr:tetratricopeptide repeat protein [Owenweeksia sp.]
MGRAFLIGGNLKAALNYYEKTLALEPENASALTGMAQCQLELGLVARAFRNLDQSLQLTFYQPHAHYLFAQAALSEEKHEVAYTALKTCLQQAPKHQQARQLLNKLSGTKAAGRQAAIMVVSGIPRSGTSMPTKMLQAGGMKIYSDDQRAADRHNSAGYFEHTAVKKLGSENSWVPQARGQVLKVVSPLLRYLPANERYKVVLVQRPLTEVILSQEIMKGQKPDEVMHHFPFQLAVDLQQEEKRLLHWLELQPNIEFMKVDYYDCLEKPAEVSSRLEAFLDVVLNHSEVAKAVQPSMHHNKLGKS